jgi:hypothetical protein
MSQRRLVARLDQLGLPLNQSVITRIERGTRKVSLDEAVALAAALDVAPVHLFMPINDEGCVSVTPSIEEPSRVARQWALGIRALDPVNTRFYGSQSPRVPDWEEEQVRRQEDFDREATAIPAEQELTEQEEGRSPSTPRPEP